MELDYLLLKNYRQYKDIKINFSHGSKQSFTVIQGVNGAGKTNILNAITWCLFGEEKHIDTKNEGLPIVNVHALDDSAGEVVEVLVEIQFLDDMGRKILISRSISYKEKNGRLVEVPNFHVSPKIQFQANGDWGYPSYGEDAQFRINSLIPQAIEEYFFFNGEKMDDYFEKKSGTEIKQAVFDISQLDLFDKVIEHLTKRKAEFVKQARGLSSEAKDIQEDLDIQENSLKRDKEQLEALNKQKNAAEALEQEFSKKLLNSSSEHIIELENRRLSLSTELSKIADDIKSEEEERLKLLHKALPIIYSYPALVKTRKIIECREEAKDIPPMFRTIFIEGLLQKGICICKSDISEHDEYSSQRRRNVEACLKRGELSEMSSEIIAANEQIRVMIDKIKDFPEEIILLEKKIKSLEDQKKQKNDELNLITEEIKNTNIQEIKKWEEQKRNSIEAKNHSIEEIGKQKYRIEQREGRIKFLNIKLKQEVKKQKKYESLSTLLNFCDESIKCAQETKESIMKEVKNQVEKKASEQFLDLIWKKNTFKAMLIDDNYNISIPYIDGREALGTLSAGEKQVCALAFLAALNSVSGFNIPIIIDTPLARISKVPRKNIAENLPTYLSGVQVILLVTEEEYTKEVQEAIAVRVGKSYHINYQETKIGGQSEVESQ